VANKQTQLILELVGEATMLQFGESIAAAITAALAQQRATEMPDQALLIALQGDLGVGKTTLSRGILTGLGHIGPVKSPTYTLVEPYELSLGTVCHFDFYRLIDAEELEYMGFQDYLVGSRLCLIEWPERGAGFMPEADLLIEIIQQGDGRLLTLGGASERAARIISQLDSEGNGV
jgi:tRNA threonylcarbamoyladenosine biosynthesis protein TsaE